MLKKISLVIGGLIVLFVIAAIAAPMVVDVDKFRPQIVQAVNQHINGDFKLGKLELSLWGGIKVKIESLSLHAKDNKALLETRAAYVEVPLLSIITLHPTLIVVLTEPTLNVTKDRSGKLNWMTLMPDRADTPPPARPPAPTKGTSSGMPAMAGSGSLGLRIEKGVISYNDEVTGNKILLDGMELNIKNLGLNDTMDLSLQLPLKGTAAGTEFGGAIETKAQVTPIFADGNVRSASGQITVNADDFHFNVSHGMVEKEAKKPLHLVMEFTGSPTDVQIKNMNFTFMQLNIGGKGTITLQPKMATHLEITSSQLNLASLQDIVPMLKVYQLAGDASLAVHVDGPTDAMEIKGEIGVSGGKVSYPAMLKAPIGYSVRTSFSKTSFTLAEFKVTGPGMDVALAGEVQNFSAPHFNFALNSKEIDTDKFLKLPDSSAAAKDGKKAEAPQPVAAGKSENPLLPLAKIPAVRDASGVVTVNIGKLVAKGAPITNIAAKATLKNMELNLESASLKAFEGALNAKFIGDLKSPGLKFSTSGLLKGFNSKAAIAAFMPKFQNTLEGKIGGKWNLAGAVYPQSALLHSLNGTLNITGEDGRLRTIDMNESIKGVLSKVSFLKSVTPPTIDQGFKSMRADIKFAGGTIDANPLEIIGNEKGVNIKGKSKIMEDMSQDTYIDVFDPNHVLPKELANGKEAVLQLHITGLATSPQTDYGYTSQRLAKNVVRNQGKDMLQKMIGNKGGNSGKTGDAINGALKKLGF